MTLPALAREAGEAAAAARRQIDRAARGFAELGERLRRRPPAFVVTCARGSSDHAASYGKYLIETSVGRAVASLGPSVASVYRTRTLTPELASVDLGEGQGQGPSASALSRSITTGNPADFVGTPSDPQFAWSDRHKRTAGLHLGDALFVAVSQSGRSPDLLRLTEAARTGGALVVGFVNVEGSPLAQLCHVALPLCAGVETSVAATKSYLLSGLAFLQLAAHWTGDPALADAALALPDALAAASRLDWWPALAPLASATSLYVLGRGVGLGAALEIALKLKETCRLHAEAFSAAEVLHGPLALVRPGFPVLVTGQDDESAASTRGTADRLLGLGARVCSALPITGTEPLPTVPGVAPVAAPLCQVQSFYMALHQLAAARSLDPDAPAHLGKVTETL